MTVAMTGDDTLRSELGALLTPRSVAVIGASEDLTKFGGRIFKLLVQHGFGGAIYPINPKREELLGLRAYPSIADTPTPPDMAVMAVQREAVQDTVAACAAAGTRAAVIITSKFSDAGPEGAALDGDAVGAEAGCDNSQRVGGQGAIYAEALAARVRNAGAIFIGAHTPEAIGDYVGGSNHVLPTARSARFSSGLGVLDFMKRTSILKCSPQSLNLLGPSAIALGEAERLEAHARSVAIRINRGAA